MTIKTVIEYFENKAKGIEMQDSRTDGTWRSHKYNPKTISGLERQIELGRVRVRPQPQELNVIVGVHPDSRIYPSVRTSIICRENETIVAKIRVLDGVITIPRTYDAEKVELFIAALKESCHLIPFFEREILKPLLREFKNDSENKCWLGFHNLTKVAERTYTCRNCGETVIKND